MPVPSGKVSLPPTPVIMVCYHCGSCDVKRDAWAEWNTATQRWELGPVYDEAHCEVCGGQTSIEEIEFHEWDSIQYTTQSLQGHSYIAAEYAPGRWKALIAGPDLKTYEIGEDWAGGELCDRDEALDAARRVIMQQTLPEPLVRNGSDSPNPISAR